MRVPDFSPEATASPFRAVQPGESWPVVDSTPRAWPPRYVAECPEVGTVSQGYTIEEAIANLKEATELYLEEFPVQKFSKPLMTTFEAAVND